MKGRATGLCVLLILFGCATHYSPNPPLATYAPNAGYRFGNLKAVNNSDSLFVILTFSGGGTRAAALSYGILEKLRDTAIEWKGERRSLLDEVDVISSVSGGSFTAAYYGLFGNAIFEEFEAAFLYRDIQGLLASALLSPANWFKLLSPTYSRIDMAAELYDREIFKGKTFADLSDIARRPYLLINATDMTMGSTFTFVQEQFDWLCSDLHSVSVARAVAASSCFPVAFPPMTLDNHAGECSFSKPDWIELALEDLQLNPRRFRQARILNSYLERADRPYIHVLDGGVADNIGLRGPLEAIRSNDPEWSILNRIDRGEIEKLVVIVVDAKTDPDVSFDRTSKPPGLTKVLTKISTVPMDNFSFDTVQALRDTFRGWRNDQRAYANCKGILNNQCPAAAMPGDPPPLVDFYPIYIGFDQISDSARRRYYQNMATSFALESKEVDDLRQIGPELLESSATFEKLINGLTAAR